MLLESLQQISVTLVKEHLCQTSKQPNWKYVFAWQSPIMFLSYALVFYMAGLTSYIASPVAQNPIWDDNAKVGTASPLIHITDIVTDAAILCHHLMLSFLDICRIVAIDSSFDT